MKTKHLKKIILSIVFAFVVSCSVAQMMGPEDPGTGPEASDPPVGSGAPLSGGVVILLTFGAIFGGNKVYHLIMDGASNVQH